MTLSESTTLHDTPRFFDRAGIIGRSEPINRVLEAIQRVAPSAARVLITGETGTGKELVASAIHQNSPRRFARFVRVNCAALHENLLESELFGHEKGAFTGADRQRIGRFEQANGGTLLLDEIGDMGMSTQCKILRVLQEGEFERLGGTTTIRTDVRVIAATNQNLAALVAKGTFREDLYYRLDVVHLKVPPLRERRDEIPALVEHFVREFAQEYDKGDVRISADTMEYLLLFRWPGNVRQLANELRRVVVMAERGSTIKPEDLQPFITAGTIKPAPAGVQVTRPNEIAIRLDQTLAKAQEQLERDIIAHAMKQAGGRLEEAATLLGLSRKGLYLKRQRLGMI